MHGYREYKKEVIGLFKSMLEEESDLLDYEYDVDDDEVHRKIEKYLHMKSEGVHLNLNLYNNKEFCNPNTYKKLIEYTGIDEFATNMSENICDSKILEEEYYYDRLNDAQKKTSMNMSVNP